MKPATHARADRIFFTGMAVALAGIVFVGFSRTYYLKDFFAGSPLSPLLHVHGVVFSVWTVFYVYQNALIAAGRTDRHRRLGIAGVSLAGLLAVVGIVVAIESVRAGFRAGRPAMDVLLANSVVTLSLFCTFFVVALLLRRKREIHKRLMLLAMISLCIPAFARLPGSPMSFWLVFVFLGAGILYDALLQRRMYVSYLLGGLLVIVTLPVRVVIAGTTGWQRVFEWVVK
jgi:hypothetical protein